jgi:hypothetical protein
MRVAVAGCASHQPTEQVDAASATESPTPAAVANLKDSCPLVEAALPQDEFKGAQLRAFLATLSQLSEAGDVETKNALKIVISASQELLHSRQAPLGRLSAHPAWLSSLDTLAERCRTVGSSALQ